MSGEQEARRGFEALGGETLYKGRIVDVRMERFRHADGEEVSREIVRHQGAVAVVVQDERDVWLVRQPREAVDEPALLEIPAGRLDVAGEHRWRPRSASWPRRSGARRATGSRS